MLVIKNGLVYINNIFIKKDLVIKDNKIFKIEDNISASSFIDATNKIITPTFSDVHVHFRYPGQTYKEDLKTGQAAAINGGYTNIVMMANTKPTIDNISVLIQIAQKLEDAKINIKLNCAITKNLAGKKLTNHHKLYKHSLVVGFSDDGHGLVNPALMKKTFANASASDFIISAHLENKKYGNYGYVINEGKKSKEFNLIGTNNEVEWKHAKADLEMLEKFPMVNYHMCHISTKKTLELLKDKKDKLNISAEVSPHHLLLSDNDIKTNDGKYKMNPPLRGKEDVNALIQGLNDGILNIIATDHAPHSFDEKNKGFESLFGIIGLDFAFSCLYTHLVKTKKVSLETIIKAMAINPAKRFKFDSPEIKIGNNASINIIDLNKEYIITKDFIKSKSKNTPFLNTKVFGYIEYVIYKGKILKG